MSKDKEEKQNNEASSELQTIQAFYEIMQQENLASLEYKDEQVHLRLVRGSLSKPMAMTPVAGTVHAPRHKEAAPSASKDKAAGTGKSLSIQTPLAGVFYRASAPTSAPFVKEGDTVDPGQTLCIVEAMKVMNEIKAESRCKILKIVAENSRPVNPGQPLFLIEPA